MYILIYTDLAHLTNLLNDISLLFLLLLIKVFGNVIKKSFVQYLEFAKRKTFPV